MPTTTSSKLEDIIERRFARITHLLEELRSELHAVRMDLFKIESEVADLEATRRHHER